MICGKNNKNLTDLEFGFEFKKSEWLWIWGLGLNLKKLSKYGFGFGLEPILKPNQISCVKLGTYPWYTGDLI